jgi:hypothetical protein
VIFWEIMIRAENPAAVAAQPRHFGNFFVAKGATILLSFGFGWFHMHFGATTFKFFLHAKLAEKKLV